jgi:serine protease
MRTFVWIMFAAIAVAAGAASLRIEHNPVRTHPQQSVQTSPQQIIVKLRATPAMAAAGAGEPTPHERVVALALRAGLGLAEHRPITERLHVMHVEPVSGETLEQTLGRLRADPDVQYAEPDGHRYAHAAVPPNDTLYPQQWYMQSSAATPSAVDAQTVWSTITTGSSALVIADIDTGVLYTHPDLLSTSQTGGRLLPGYCFISDAFVANNSSCPGPDASDPGDWVTQSDLSNSECANAQVANSSWHGTRTAGILGAITDNNVGIAGMTWNSQILPVRALGKCGGFDSDIISAMLWAAGLSVVNVPANTQPAKIINMSLGGTGACPQSYQDAITQVTALGVLVVISAGNEGGPVDAPANCTGVAGVAGLRQAGTKVGFSSLGPEVALSAPAGNCVNETITPQTPCLYSIETTFNDGQTTPDPNGNTYTDQVGNPNLGTSFSAPIVSGIAALMSAANSKLNSCQLIARLQEGAQPFPQTSAGESTQPPMCHVPANSNDVQDAECICTLDGQTCGAGMANAPGALTAALRPIAAVSVPTSVTAGQSVTLQAGGSAAANNHTISTYQWTTVSGATLALQGASTATATVSLPSCGLTTVRLTVTDDAGRQDTANVVVGPNSVTTSAPATAGSSAACTGTAPAIALDVCPGSTSIQAGSGTESFTASVANTSNSGVTWQVNGIVGGNTTVGTISTTGVYTAPTSVPSPSMVTVSAVSAADSTVSASAQVSVTAPPAKAGGGGGALDGLTLLALGLLALLQRPAARRSALSSHTFCARR